MLKQTLNHVFVYLRALFVYLNFKSAFCVITTHRSVQKLRTLVVFVFDCHQIIQVNVLTSRCCCNPSSPLFHFRFHTSHRIHPSNDHWIVALARVLLLNCRLMVPCFSVQQLFNCARLSLSLSLRLRLFTILPGVLYPYWIHVIVNNQLLFACSYRFAGF